MKKNIVFMMDVDIKGEGRYSSSRRLAYKYSIDSWKKWCNKNNSEGFLFYNGLLYGFFNSIQVAAMLWLGMFSAEYFFQGILALLPMFIFQYLGILMRQRLSLLSFNRVVIAILGVIELKLVWDIMVDWNLI